MDVDQLTAALASRGPAIDAPGVRRWFVSWGEGWHDDAGSGLATWQAWRGARPIRVVTIVRGAPSVLELEVGDGPAAAVATVVCEFDGEEVREVRIYVDPEAAA